MLRHAGAPCSLCGGSGPACHRSASICGTNCPTAWRWTLPPKRAGPRRRAPTRRLPSASSICPIKQRLTRFSGIPKAAARTSSAGRRKAEKPVAELEIYRPGRGIRPIGTRVGRFGGANGSPGRARAGSRRPHRQQIRHRDPASPRRRSRPARFPAWASKSASTNPICGSPAGPARATPCRPGARRSPAC